MAVLLAIKQKLNLARLQTKILFFGWKQVIGTVCMEVNPSWRLQKKKRKQFIHTYVNAGNVKNYRYKNNVRNH